MVGSGDRDLTRDGEKRIRLEYAEAEIVEDAEGLPVRNPKVPRGVCSIFDMSSDSSGVSVDPSSLDSATTISEVATCPVGNVSSDVRAGIWLESDSSGALV